MGFQVPWGPLTCSKSKEVSPGQAGRRGKTRGDQGCPSYLELTEKRLHKKCCLPRRNPLPIVIFLRGESRQWWRSRQAQVQCLIAVSVGVGAKGGESPGTSQNSVATQSPSWVPALFFVPTSLVRIRAKFLLPPLYPLLRLKSLKTDSVRSRPPVLFVQESSVYPHSFLPPLVTAAWLFSGETHTHTLSLPFSLLSHRLNLLNNF